MNDDPRPRTDRSRRRRAAAGALCAVLLLATACSSDDDEGASERPGGTTSTTAAGGGPGDCPTEVDAEEFTTPEELRELLATYNSFGLRTPGSEEHEAAIEWLADELAEVPDMEIAWEEFDITTWHPTAEAPGDTPGYDLATSGALSVGADGEPEPVTISGAIPFSLPTGDDGVGGELVYIPADQEITAANSAGKIIVRDNPPSSIPYDYFPNIDHHLTDDLPTEGDYDRPYLRTPDQVLIDAGIAGAAGVVVVWDAPTDQLTGYWDPHSGTKFKVPAVYVGNDTGAELQRLAAEGTTADLTVLAEWRDLPTRNLMATLPGKTDERIVVNTNTDSVTWVQENGTIASVALARYLGSLPAECRERDVVFALTSNHLGYNQDGAGLLGEQLDREYDDGTVAFVMSPEHLGTKEILPTGEGRRLEYSGEPELFAWSAPVESPVLVEATVDAVIRRELTRTAVLEGVGVPGDTLPAICSQGGLGTVFHSHLVPTIAGISGPWSLWAPEFGEEAIDFERMRNQSLAFGDIAIALDDVPLDEIAGDYPEARRQRAEGAESCPLDPPPSEAPGPGAPVTED